MADNSEIKYVTYKQLITWLLSAMGVTLTITFFMVNSFTKALEKKLDVQVYDIRHNELCSDVSEIKMVVKDNAYNMEKLKINQELVLRALKIPPVK